MMVLAEALSRFFFSSSRRHTRYIGDWSSDVCSSDLPARQQEAARRYQAEAATVQRQLLADHVERGPRVELEGSPVGDRGPAQIGRASCRERVGSARDGAGSSEGCLGVKPNGGSTRTT